MRKEHVILDNKELKICSSCKQTKELIHFSKYTSAWDGLKPYCKECASKKGKQYRITHSKKVLESKRQWYKKTKQRASERTEKALNLNKKICSKCNKELDIYSFRERTNGGFYSVCKICENKYNKEYRGTHRDVYTKCHVATEQRRRKYAQNVISDLTTKEWDNIQTYFDFKCAYCGKGSVQLTQDHVIPLSKGGNYTKSNIIPACRTCNAKKNNKLIDEWYSKQKFYSKNREEKIINYLKSCKVNMPIPR